MMKNLKNQKFIKNPLRKLLIRLLKLLNYKTLYIKKKKILSTKIIEKSVTFINDKIRLSNKRIYKSMKKKIFLK